MDAEELRLSRDIIETIRKLWKKKLIEGISEKSIEHWAKIELLIRLGIFHDKDSRKKLVNEISKMNIPNWIKVWFLRKAEVPQDEDGCCRFMRMVIYGVWSKELETYEETPQIQLGLSPIEAFLFKLHRLLKLAEERDCKEIKERLQRIKERILAREDFTFEDCRELRSIELKLQRDRTRDISKRK